MNGPYHIQNTSLLNKTRRKSTKNVIDIQP